MQVKYSFLCSAANLSTTHNLNALGIFDTLNVQKFPHILPKFTYVANIEFHRSELGAHKFRLVFIDPEGREVIPPFNGEINVSARTLKASLLIELASVRFLCAGTYHFDLTIDNVHVCTDSLYLKELPQTNR
ncbi:MAG: DUF6941 family protein [Oscillospiraceae bacterium]|jgi:hypothetical protein